MDWQKLFKAGHGYGAFLETHGSPSHRDRWASVHERVKLTPEQKALLAGFSRRMNVLCLAGAWCGDCANQCPIFDHFARASKRIDLRFLDRDQHPDAQEALTINAGHRIPIVVFLSEDFQECGRYGERTLSKYREMASTLLGAACPTGLSGGDASLEAVTAEWLDEFERIQLMLRLSPRLREKHRD